MNNIKVKELSGAERFFDKLMFPVMLILGKLRKDSVQETHAWHIQKIDSNWVNTKMSLKMPLDDTSVHQGRNLFLFHAPIFGGWSRYSVYEVALDVKLPFHVGWIKRDKKSSKVESCVNRLPIFERKIRLLNGTPRFDVIMFAVSSEGVQVPIKKVDKGKLGDNKDADIRLF